jgi:hypothetical protein
MKLLFSLVLLLSCSLARSQDITKKYNDLSKRYEYFNRNGSMIGYETYDSYSNSWKYYEVPQRTPSTYVEPIDTDLVERALNKKQSRFDTNIAKIDAAVKDIGNKIVDMDISEDAKERILDRFNKGLQRLSASKPNYASTAVTHNIITWMYSEVNKVIKEETN